MTSSETHPEQTAPESPARRTDDESARRAVSAVWRADAARIVATVSRYTGNFALAEDLAQDALAEALERWPQTGVPRNGAAWLTTTAKRRAIDHWRRMERHDERMALLAHELDSAAESPPWDPDEIDDDVLRLVFIACHPVLPQQSRVALTLRVVAGLSTEEIARAFLVPVATVQQRIVRAKKALADEPFVTPAGDERTQRLGAVLGVVYLGARRHDRAGLDARGSRARGAAPEPRAFGSAAA